MKFDIIIAGVGGQGILSLAFVIDNACVKKGLSFKQAEVHGMSQRGGAVQSHLRISDAPIYSDLIPQGKADLILAVEPLEVNRYLSYLSPEGFVISNSQPVVNIPDYPELTAVHDHINSLPRSVLVDAKRLAEAAGNNRAQNMVLLGLGTTVIPFFTEEELIPFIEVLFQAKGERIVDLNLKAFRYGRRIGALAAGLGRLGVEADLIFKLTSRIDPEEARPEDAEKWAAALKEQGEVALP